MNLFLTAMAIFALAHPNAKRPEYVEPLPVVFSIESESSIESPIIMQDINQCVVVDGVMLCLDICGGRSEIGTICNYE